LLSVDAAGRYNMQIFRVGRPPFASGDKAQERRKNIARR
jgi:hypothetical protein